MSLRNQVRAASIRISRRVSRRFSSELKREIGDAIKEEILAGRSPVAGKKFPDYSDSYAKVKGRRRPVDLFVTGEMIESLRVVQNRVGSVMIFFRSLTAQWHDGRRARVVRRLLPRRGERFSRPIRRVINDVLRRAIRRER